MTTKKTGARAPSPKAASAAIVTPEAYFKLSEDAEHQLYRVRQLLETMAELLEGYPRGRRVELSSGSLATTLNTLSDLLDLPSTYVSPYPRSL